MKNKQRTPEQLKKLTNEILQTNKANGWDLLKPSDWNDSPEKIATKLMLISTEISEAFEAYRKDDIDNFLEECADVVIRIFDMMGGLEIDVTYYYQEYSPEILDWTKPFAFGSRMLDWNQHLLVARGMHHPTDWKEGFVASVSNLLSAVYVGCDALYLDLDHEVRRKMEVNKGRGHRHGGKRV